MHKATVAIALLIALASPMAQAQDGLIHEGCDPAATFSAGPITVSAAFTRAMPPRAPTAAGYFTISNSGGDADTLLGATSAAAGGVSLHAMSMKDTMMTMAPVEGGLAVPAGGSVTLSPEGYHLMFEKPASRFKEGECVELTLHFAKAGDLPIVLSVAGVSADAPPDHQMQMDPNMLMEGIVVGPPTVK
jgi:copper(I)-binding protein